MANGGIGGFPLPHIPVLDGVRGLAISMVLAFHLFWIPYESFAPSALSRIFAYGWLGVDLFFVLSGFLVTLVLHALPRVEGGLSLFFRRRALRIVPAYVATLLLAYLVVGPLSPVLGLSSEQPSIFWFLFALQNYLFAIDQLDWKGLWHYWSLAIEIQFYLVWPLLVNGRRSSSVSRICVTVFAAAVACKVGLLAAAPDDWKLSYALPLTRADAFAAGGLAAMAYGSQRALVPGLGLLAVLLCMLAGGLYIIESTELSLHTQRVVLTPAVAVFFMCGIIWLTDRRSSASFIRKSVESPALRALGKYSYGMYLLHFIAIAHVEKVVHWLADAWSIHLNIALTLAGIAVAILTWCFARLMYAYVEAPFLRLR